MITPDYYEDTLLAFARYPEAGTGRPDALVYTALGVAGEASELLEKVFKDRPAAPNEFDMHDMILELGDVLWYVCRSWQERTGKPVQALFDDAGVKVDPNGGYAYSLGEDNPYRLALTLSILAGRYADAIKKQQRDQIAPLGPEGLPIADITLAGLLGTIHLMALALRVDLDIVMRENIQKLTSRAARGKLGGSGDHR